MKRANSKSVVRRGQSLDTGWRSKADSPFVPPRVVLARGSVGRDTDDDSEDETQLPKNQPIWIEEKLDNAGRQSEEDGSDSATQLPQDQPPYDVETVDASNEDTARDFVPVSSMFLGERVSEDEDDIPFKVLLQRQKGSKTNDSQDDISEDDDNMPVATILTRENTPEGMTPTEICCSRGRCPGSAPTAKPLYIGFNVTTSCKG